MHILNLYGGITMQDKTKFYYRPTHANHELECFLSLARYSCNDRTCIQLYSYDEDYDQFIPYATLTVNLPDSTPTNNHCVFVDINNCPWVLHLLIEILHIGTLTANFARSGFCLYPEIQLNPDELCKYC